MNTMEIQMMPIGIVRTPFEKASGTPIQPCMADDVEGWVEVLPEYREGLADLQEFERIWLLYWCDRVSEAKLRVKPYLDKAERGLFATRAPARPNQLGMSCVRLGEVKDNGFSIFEVDILDRTPLLDIKPYVSRFDSYPDMRVGWLDVKGAGSKEKVSADGRFEKRRE